MSNYTNIASLDDILTSFFVALAKGNMDVQSPFSMALWTIFHHASSPQIISCALDDESAAETIRQIKNALFTQKPDLPKDIDFKGTMVLVRIPAQIPNDFNMYDYMS